MKIIAWHLPQFHEIPENNKWWGEGFTEWVNVKKAKPLFENHNQPREPYNDNYYNMLDKQTMIWENNLAKNFGIYGFCYYHYWFNGKMLLEKPLENLLKWQEIDLPFCMSWANEPWTKAWDGVEKEILMPQHYGSEKEWKNHFEYLLDFFKDERYIKVENKPMFLIYKTMSIPNCDKMIKYWDGLAVENGFDGIYLVETLNGMQKKAILENSKMEVYMEPTYTMNNCKSVIDKIKRKIFTLFNRNKYIVESYDKIWKKIINRRYIKNNKKKALGGFLDWDNSPRRSNNATIFQGVKVEKFKKYLKKQIINSNNMKNEYIFINAWNEWAEGTYLEPDKKNGYKYLEVIKSLVDK